MKGVIKMKCGKCGTECPDGNIFCEACGAELVNSVLPDNVDEKGRVKKKKTKEKKAKEKKTKSPEEKAAFLKKLKIIGIVIALIAVGVLIFIVANLIGGNSGFNAAQRIPLGRNIEYASSETKLVFTDECSNGLINSMSDFDYICVSEDTVKISGSEQPAWAIMLNCGPDNIITEVEFYDFRQLKNNWKGRKLAEMLSEESLDYGMNIKNVNKALGLKPYYFKRNVSNDAVYCYRYFHTDAEAGYDRAYNYYVEFSDVELAVRNVHYSEIDYAGTILNVGNNAISQKIDIAQEILDEASEEQTDETSEDGENTEAEE